MYLCRLRLCLCVLCACALLLAGCEQAEEVEGAAVEPPIAELISGTGGIDGADAADAADASEPSRGDENTVVLAFLRDSPIVDEWAAGVQAGINGILAAENARLRLELRPMSYEREMMQTEPGLHGVITGEEDEAADLFLWELSALKEFAQEKYVLDLTDGLAAFPALYAVSPERVWQETRRDGRIYCFPLMGGTGQWGREARVTLRSGILEQLGLETPASPDELFDMALAARERGEGSAPYKIIYDLAKPPYALHATYEEWPFIVDEQSRFILYADGSVEPYVDSDIFQKDCAFLQRCAQEDLLLVIGEAFKFEDRMVAIASFNPSILYFKSETRPDGLSVVKDDDRIEVSLAPDSPDIRMTPCARNAIYVSNRCRDPHDALLMLEYLYTNRAINDLLVYGEQGKDWLLYEDGTADIRFTASWWNNFRHDGFIRDSHGARGAQTKVRADFPASGFVFEEEMPRRMEWLTLAFNDVWLYRMGGTTLYDPDGIMAELNDKGYQALLDECARQYEAFIKATTTPPS